MTDDKLTVSKLREAIAKLKKLEADPMLIRIELALGEVPDFSNYLGILRYAPDEDRLGVKLTIMLGVDLVEVHDVRRGEARFCRSDGTSEVKIWRANGL